MEKSNNIEVILTRPYYALGEAIKDGEVRIEALGIVDPKDYPSVIKLGAWMDEGELYVQPYFEAKVRGENIVNVKGKDKKVEAIAVTIKVERSVAVEIEKICIASNGKPYQKHDTEVGNYVYYLPPKDWKEDKRTGKKYFEKNPNEHMTVGSQTIQIHWKDKSYEHMHLISRYEEKDDFFRDLILDLIAMNQKLVVDEKSTMSVSENWSIKSYQQMEQMIKEFCEVFRQLEKNVQPNLKLSHEKQSFQKVKKITSRVLIEHEMFHKDKVTANVYREDFDTFEHRVIRTFIERLKKMIKVRRDIEIIELENEISDFKEYQLSDKEAKNIEKIEKDFQDKLQEEREGREKQLKKELLNINVKKVKMQFQLEDSLDYNVKKKNGAEDRWVRIWGMNLKLNDERNSPRCYLYNRNRWEEVQLSREKKIKEISFPINCKAAAIMFFKYLSPEHEFFAKGDTIEVCGEIEENGIKASEYIFRFRNVEEIRKVVYQDPFSMYFLQEEEAYYKKRLSLEEENCLWEDYKKFVLELDSASMVSENYALFTALKDGAKKVRELEDGKTSSEEKIKEKWRELEKQLDKLLKNSFMENVSEIRTEFQISNLFLFHPAYQKIYKIMKEDFRQLELESVDYYKENARDSVPISGAADLYERWCCLKMVFTFIHLYGFELVSSDKEGKTGVEGLKQYISEVLEGKDTLSQTKFELVASHIAFKNMKITIWYEPAIDIGGKMPLRPDFVLKITDRGKSHLFVFDAKYRGIHENDYDNYDGVEDICNVAFRQYTLRLEKGIKEGTPFYDVILPDKKISGSFILHSNSKAAWKPAKELTTFWENKLLMEERYKAYKEIDLVYNPQRYLGAYIDVWGERWFDAVRAHELEQEEKEGKDKRKDDKKRKLETSLLQLNEWSKWPSNPYDSNNNENRLGIAVLNPKDNKLVYIIQMIMEKYYGYYKEICWLCGKEVNQEDWEKKYTESGYRKYYIRCADCKKMTVETHCIGYRDLEQCHSGKRLGKHVENYYVQSDKENRNARWNVSCPICRRKLISNSRRESMERIKYDEEWWGYTFKNLKN